MKFSCFHQASTNLDLLLQGVQKTGFLCNIFYLCFSIFFILIIWPLIYFFRRKPRPAEKRLSKNIPVKHKLVAAGVALFLLAFYISFALALGAGQEVVSDG
jgi:drug/metabolite transporter (DMT)-like permease